MRPVPNAEGSHSDTVTRRTFIPLKDDEGNIVRWLVVPTYATVSAGALTAAYMAISGIPIY